jgi:hypothetical protein
VHTQETSSQQLKGEVNQSTGARGIQREGRTPHWLEASGGGVQRFGEGMIAEGKGKRGKPGGTAWTRPGLGGELSKESEEFHIEEAEGRDLNETGKGG